MNEAIVASTRFGLGAGGPAAPDSATPQAWLKSQLTRPDHPSCLDGLPDAASAVKALLDHRAAQQDPTKAATIEMLKADYAKAVHTAELQEIAARYLAALHSTSPLIERLVAFWSNHFTVSGVRPDLRPMIGPFEREAIRPHVTGRFEDMVLAVVRHPTMGLYLDNAVSAGPGSQVGQHGGKGINENLGRELLELHTLGVDGGYTEQDVRALARILTGWSISRLKDPDPGHFRFRPGMHEPGPQILLGRTYAQSGEDQGRAAIHDIAHNGATARHIARKLAAHFIADAPPPEAVDRLAAVFRDSGGDLRLVTEALIGLPAAWLPAPRKVKTPWELVVSASLATGVTLAPDQVATGLRRLGQPVFMAPQPSGWPDDAASWIGPEAMLRRIDWCASLAARADPAIDPTERGHQVLGDGFNHATSAVVAGADSRKTGLALLLAAPAFQRR